MLFPFDQPTTPSFWMKDMRFSIDIIWINNGRIIGIEQNLQSPGIAHKGTTPIRYPAPGAVTDVLEAQAGWTAAHGVGIGDFVTEP
jgi:uncharacterized protein